MIYSLNSGGAPKGRLWIEEFPDALLLPESYVEERLMAERIGTPTVSRLALEVFIGRGPRADYGLLGAEFVSDNSGIVTVKVAVANEPRARLDWSLDLTSDRVSARLPGPEAGAVAQSVMEEIGRSGFFSGCLSFCWAAYGDAYSNRYIFRHLSNIVTFLFTQNIPAISEDELTSLVLVPPNQGQ